MSMKSALLLPLSIIFLMGLPIEGKVLAQAGNPQIVIYGSPDGKAIVISMDKVESIDFPVVDGLLSLEVVYKDGAYPIDKSFSFPLRNLTRIEFRNIPEGGTGSTGKGFYGQWSYSMGSAGTINMVQQGNQVTGNYVHGTISGTQGTIKGTVTGQTLRGTWANTANKSGTLEFRLSADGRSFSGFYVFEGKNYPWNGTRK